MKVTVPDLCLKKTGLYNGDDATRVSKVGKSLRKNIIDDIPEFLNVLIGNMSF